MSGRKHDTPTCPAPLAYRDMSDIGSRRVCGNPAQPSGFCRRHDPATKPLRDAKGRIIAKPRELARPSEMTPAPPESRGAAIICDSCGWQITENRGIKRDDPCPECERGQMVLVNAAREAEGGKR